MLAIVVLVVLTVTSPGWDRVQATYFDVSYAREVLPDLARAFVLNIKLFVVSEILILIVALVVAVIRVVPRRPSRPSNCSLSSIPMCSAAPRRCSSSSWSASGCRRFSCRGSPPASSGWA